MIYEEKINKVRCLVSDELEEIKKLYGEKYNSVNEAYGVLFEEVEEVKDDLERIESMLNLFFNYGVRKNDTKEICESSVVIYNTALHLAYEAVQVAAVAKKTIRTFE